jgi:FkbM family methyltransferase
MNKKTLKRLFSKITGKKKMQLFFEKLHGIALIGMHIGSGANVTEGSSGERGVIEYIAQKYKAKKTIIVFDVGANVGNYTILANKVLQEKSKIFAFEPSKETYKRYKENTTKIQGVRHYNLGFGNENTNMTLYSNAESSGLASVYKREISHFQIQMNLEETIEIQTIDTFCSQNNIGYIDLLKLDVEGHELKVLEGAKEMIKSGKIDCIQFEFGGCNIDSRTYFRDFFHLLKKNKYNMYRIVKDGLYPINEYKETYECFVTTNFFAEHIQ